MFYIISVLWKLSHDRRRRTVQWPRLAMSEAVLFAPERKKSLQKWFCVHKNSCGLKFGLRRFGFGKDVGRILKYPLLFAALLPCIHFAFCYNSICTYEQCLQRNTFHWSWTDLWISTQNGHSTFYNTARTIPFAYDFWLRYVINQSIKFSFFHGSRSHALLKPGILRHLEQRQRLE